MLTARRDAPFAALNTVARAAAMVSENPTGALQKARAERPDDYALHEAIETRTASVPATPATITAFNQTAVSDLGATIGPMTGINQVATRAHALDLDGAATLSPHWNSEADTAGFYAPGSSISVKQAALGSAVLTPHKVGAIVVLTTETTEHTKNAEKNFRTKLIEDVGRSIDKLFFDDVETDGIRPSGLRFGVAALTTDGPAHIQEDLTALAAAVAAKASSVDDIVYVASPDVAVKIMLALPNLKIPVISTGGLSSGTILCMVPPCLAIAASPKILWSVSDETVLHMDSEPTALSAAGTPNVTSAPNRSMYQTSCKALRLTFELDWKWRTANAIAWMTSITWGADAE